MKRIIVIAMTLLLKPSMHAAAAASSTSTSVAVSTPPPIAPASNSLTLSTQAIASGPDIRAIHLTASAAGSKKYRGHKLDQILHETIVNAVVIDLKDEGGEVYVPGVKAVERAGAYRREIPDLEAFLAELKKRNVYTVGRICVFKDNILPRQSHDLAVHNSNGEIWFDRKHVTWLDPYNHDAWRYILLIALQASKLGFDEIQFDYIRFPTDGALAGMRFSKPYSKKAASEALVQFLGEAHQLLHPMGVKLSIDLFGLTTSVNSGMGIGQVMDPMADQVDYVCPMTYPSHYNRGEYGMANPNDQPYRTVSLAMRDAIKRLGPQAVQKLRPYLQDFSLKGRGIPYRAREVRAQIQAAADEHVSSWTLWNASCHYTLDAIRAPIVPSASSSTVKTAN